MMESELSVLEYVEAHAEDPIKIEAVRLSISRAVIVIVDEPDISSFSMEKCYVSGKSK